MRFVTFLASRSVPGAPPAAAIAHHPAPAVVAGALPTHHHPSVAAAAPRPGGPVWADGPALLAHRAGEQVGRRLRASRPAALAAGAASRSVAARPRPAAPRRGRRARPGAAAAPRALLGVAGVAAAAAKAAGAAAAGLAATFPPAGAAAVAAVGGLAALSRLRGATGPTRGAMRTHAAGRHAAHAAPHAREVSIVTFNVRGVMDRWPERAPLLAGTLRRLDADVYCFQEVLTGEFRQDAEMVGDGYTVYECRAALESVAATGLAGAGYAAVMRGLLSLSLCRAALVAAPPAVEGFRERHELSGSWARTLRDAAIAPFFGNSLASRLAPSPPPGLEAFAAEEVTVGCGGGGRGGEVFRAVKGAGGPGHEVLLLGHFRAAQRVCLALSPSAPSARGGSSQSVHSTRSAGGGVELQQMRSDGSNGDGSGGSGGSGNEEEGRTAAPGDWQRQGAAAGVTEEPLRVWLVNTHLDHASAETREAQARAIVEWMAPVAALCAGVVITGDLNAPPGEGTHWVLQNAGYYSAAKLANGAEPATTWPSGLVAPLMDTGEPHCADYVYVLQSPGHEVRVEAARVAGDAPSAADATLYPSDHFGLSVKLSVARRAAAG